MPTKAIELEVGERSVRVSSPDKVYFPDLGLTKLDVVQYYLSVAEGMVAALYQRPTTMERWPGGVREGMRLVTRMGDGGDAFYQKRVPKGAPDWVQTATITFPSGRTADEVCPTEPATLAWMGNLGTLRFHPWPVRMADTEAVDELRIDLDPQPGTDFGDSVIAAQELRGVLEEAGLVGWPKTSGGRGVHVFVPVQGCSFVDARHAVIAIGRELARRMPDRVTTNWWKEERGERIFVDYNQMARDRTIASAYSVRPVPQARVSAPLTWQELPEVAPDDFTVVTMPARYAELGDVWKPMYGSEPGDIGIALDWYARDATSPDGGEMPYPPEYPKMPGEPARVQPSRKVAANWEGEN
ncbi:DNA polymerase domain-containing protein [Naumannella sp. ID2617S]|nr:DNA polymerase domain-containing protein [Naumannella sp. ID2617S]